MLEIGIVQQRGAALCARVFRVEVQGQAQQRLHRVVRERHAREQGRRGRAERLRHLFAGLHAGGAPGLDVLRQLRIVGLLHIAHPREGELAGARAVPAEAQRAGKLTQLLRARLEVCAVALLRLFVGAHEREDALELLRPVVRPAPQVLEKLSAPGRFGHVGDRGAQLFDHFRGPFVRPGVALHPAVQLEHQLAQAAVVPSRADRVGQREEAGMRLRVRVALLHRPIERRGLHLRGAVVLDDAEIRREAEQMAVLPQQLRAEAVDRLDGGAAAQRALAAQMTV